MFVQAIHWFLNLGSTVGIPIIIIILGLIVGLKPSKALISGLTLSAGFIGMNMVVNMMATNLQPAIKLMVARYHLSLSIMDVGCGVGGPLAFSSSLGVLAIPLTILINLVLVWIGLTRTLNVDIWNLWQPTFIGLLVWAVSGNYVYGIIALAGGFLLELLLADLMQPITEKFFNLPGIAVTHTMALSATILAVPLNWLFDKIPGFNKLDASPEKIQKRFGVLGDPLVIGFIVGVGIGLLAGFDVSGILQLGVEMGATLKIMPKMISMFMESLTPISSATQEFTKKHLHGKKVNIGMDAALTVGHPAVIATSVLMIPISLFLATILPGNKVLPLGDLTLYVYVFTLLVGAFKGNIIRSLIGAVIYSVPMLYLSTWLSPLVMKSFKLANYSINTKGAFSFELSGLWTNSIFVWMTQNFGVIGLGVLIVVLLGLLYYLNVIKKFNAGPSAEKGE